MNRPAIANRWRVLVVDDDADVARSLAMILECQGHQVRTAFDGATALQTAQSFEPELVTLDIAMPRMDGYEICRRLRATPQGRHMVIVAATAHGERTDKRRARIAGFDSHMLKPVDPAEVERLLAGLAPRPGPGAPSEGSGCGR